MSLTTVESILLFLLVLDAIALIVLVLIQQGKGADVGAAFGSGSANTMFGSLGAATFFTKATAWLAILFFVITFALAYTARERAEAAGTLGIPQAVETVEETVEEAPVELETGDIPTVQDAEGDVPSDIPEV